MSVKSGGITVIEDYMRAGRKFAALVITRLCCFGLAAAGIIATLQIALIE